jgi:STE24 endopeptidase
MSDELQLSPTTVSRVNRPSWARLFASVTLTLAAAELGRRILAPRKAIPEPAAVDLNRYFSPEQIARGAHFARPQRVLAMSRVAVDLAALSLVVVRPPRPIARAEPMLRGAVVGAGMAVALSLPSLPLAAIARRRAIDVGLITQSWGGWAVDLIKADAIQAALAAAGGATVVAATRRYPNTWWLPMAATSVLIGGVIAAAAPVLLDPLFNDFTPLPSGETRSDVLALAAKAGVKVGEVFSVDASRRTTAANAYVTGLGPTKRVVLYDTLLDRYDRDEVRVVVAHELAHVRGRDVLRGIVFGAIVAPAVAFSAQQLSWRLSAERGTAEALPALALATAVVSAPIGLIGNRLSRALERRADAYSLDLAGSPDAFVSFERAIALQNVADLDPPRWVTAILATHPPSVERIGAALAWSAQRRDDAELTPPMDRIPGDF